MHIPGKSSEQNNNLNQGEVAIVGLGLIGGSIARRLHSRGVRVIGFDTDADT
ncbi:MAG: NAD(P)-dependent oxidoreductase, partial [Eubacteriales bacterium]|nr:NAD(P)-dependent oxidoreductase [Eubacteriales bacterium]